MKAVVFPGQGAQRRGMGRELFDAYPGLADEASEVLGYSLRTLCLDDPHRQLGRTEYTQPALFVVGGGAPPPLGGRPRPRPAGIAGATRGGLFARHPPGAVGMAARL
ncbi:acyltransferase domain-containing protein, partial [Streptomyces nigrescens]